MILDRAVFESVNASTLSRARTVATVTRYPLECSWQVPGQGSPTLPVWRQRQADSDTAGPHAIPSSPARFKNLAVHVWAPCGSDREQLPGRCWRGRRSVCIFHPVGLFGNWRAAQDANRICPFSRVRGRPDSQECAEGLGVLTCVSDWYSSIGEFSFPTVFVRLDDRGIESLVNGQQENAAARQVWRRLQRAIRALPGSGFVGADACVPTDSPHYRQGFGLSFGRKAWRLLATSGKTRAAFENGLTERLTVRPFRRMDRAREFRMFFYRRTLVGMSQYCLLRHYARLAKRESEIWRRGRELAAKIAPLLPAENQVADVYLCSDGYLLLVDLNDWGGSTDPKLFKTWDRNWEEEAGLRLIPRPIRMKGDVSVSF